MASLAQGIYMESGLHNNMQPVPVRLERKATIKAENVGYNQRVRQHLWEEKHS